LNNAGLRPENQTSYEIGTELNFFSGRLYLDFTYYNQTTTDQILEVATSGATGFTRRVVNAGEIKNSGIEIVLNTVPVEMGDFRWEVGGNFARNQNEVVRLFEDDQGNEVTSITYTSLFGPELQARVGQPWGVLVGTDFMYDDAGNKLVSESGIYMMNPEVQALGSVLADFTGGVNTRLSYKGFSLYALFDFQKGGSLFSLSNMWGKYSGLYEETAANNVREEGIVAEGVYAEGTTIDGQDVGGQENQTTIPAINHFFLNQGYVINDADVYDASFIKFREIRLSYNLPSSVLGNSFLKSVRVSLVGRNLGILSKNIPHIDPEHALSISNIQGFEGGALPPERSLGLNLNIKL
jgi:outer membrane receptor protein involved in Fe transport